MDSGDIFDTPIDNPALPLTWHGLSPILSENGVLDDPESTPPSNLQDIRQYLEKDRMSPEPNEKEFRLFKHDVTTAPNKDTVAAECYKLMRRSDNVRYVSVKNQQFNLFPPNVGFNNGLPSPKPGLVEGFQQSYFRPFHCLLNLDEAAVPYDGWYPIALPHFLGEFKDHYGSWTDARSQAAYGGASLVYARQQALEYLKEEENVGHASVVSWISDGHTIYFYAHHLSPDPIANEERQDKGEDRKETEERKGKEEEQGEEEQGEEEKMGQKTLVYHQFQLDGLVLRSYEDFLRGRKYLRNLQDFAFEEAQSLRGKLMSHGAKAQIVGKKRKMPSSES